MFRCLFIIFIFKILNTNFHISNIILYFFNNYIRFRIFFLSDLIIVLFLYKIHLYLFILMFYKIRTIEN